MARRTRKRTAKEPYASGKRDLMSGKRDLFSGKRDLFLRQNSPPATIPDLPATHTAHTTHPRRKQTGLQKNKKETSLALSALTAADLRSAITGTSAAGEMSDVCVCVCVCVCVYVYVYVYMYICIHMD